MSHRWVAFLVKDYMANVIYNSFKKHIMNGGIDLDTDTIKVALVTADYTPSQDDHEYFDDITNEITGDGYTSGGATLSGISVTQNNTDNTAVVDATDTSWASASFTARGAVIYKSTGDAETSPLIKYVDFGANKTVVNDTFVIIWDADGVFTLG